VRPPAAGQSWPLVYMEREDNFRPSWFEGSGLTHSARKALKEARLYGQEIEIEVWHTNAAAQLG
jgi:hypothetical protein